MPNRSRAALQEIPQEFDSPDDEALIRQRLRECQWLDTPTSASFRNIVNRINGINLDKHISPDELVIRQRGPRQCPTRNVNSNVTPVPVPTFVSEPIPSPFQHTPPKLVTTSMILGGSPCRRLRLDSTPPLTATETRIVEKRVFNETTTTTTAEPLAKKARVSSNECPLAQINTDVPLQQILSAMTNTQLVDIIINNLLAGDSQKEENLRKQLPMPDIAHMEQSLCHLKNNIYKSLPNSFFMEETDNHCYMLAVIHLNEFKQSMCNQMLLLHEGAHWDALLDYSLLAWSVVKATPNFDHYNHNMTKRICFRVLAKHCALALDKARMKLGVCRLQNLKSAFTDWQNDCSDAKNCQRILEDILTKEENNTC